MQISALPKLLDFAKKHPVARQKLLAWRKLMEACTAKDLNELKLTFSSADYVPKDFIVFNIGGNAYRIVAVISFQTQLVRLHIVGTHSEYDTWTKENRGK